MRQRSNRSAPVGPIGASIGVSAALGHLNPGESETYMRQAARKRMADQVIERLEEARNLENAPGDLENARSSH